MMLRRGDSTGDEANEGVATTPVTRAAVSTVEMTLGSVCCCTWLGRTAADNICWAVAVFVNVWALLPAKRAVTDLH